MSVNVPEGYPKPWTPAPTPFKEPAPYENPPQPPVPQSPTPFPEPDKRGEHESEEHKEHKD